MRLERKKLSVNRRAEVEEEALKAIENFISFFFTSSSSLAKRSKHEDCWFQKGERKTQYTSYPILSHSHFHSHINPQSRARAEKQHKISNSPTLALSLLTCSLGTSSNSSLID